MFNFNWDFSLQLGTMLIEISKGIRTHTYIQIAHKYRINIINIYVYVCMYVYIFVNLQNITR